MDYNQDNMKLEEISLSERAKAQIKKYISRMDLNQSNKLPREEALADIIGVSRITIRAALNDLASEGLIFRRQGKGTFVNVDSLNIKVKFNPAMEFTQMIQASGYTPSVKLLNIAKVPMDQQIKTLLLLDSGEELVKTAKIFLADNKICAYCVDYFGLSLVGGQESFGIFSHYENSIFEYIYQTSGVKIEWDKVEIDTMMGKELPDFDQYEELKSLSETPLLRLGGINYNAQDQPVIYALEFIDTSFIKFSMIRQRSIRY